MFRKSVIELFVAAAGILATTALCAQPQAQVFWLEAGVHRANLDGSGLQSPVSELGDPLALAVDNSSGKIYWGVGASSLSGGWIRRSNPDGSAYERVVWTPGMPVGMAVDESDGRLYWIEWGGHGPTIRRATLDGRMIETIVSEGLTEPVSISVDAQGGRIYWTDRSEGTISRANRNGSGREIVISDADAFGLAIDGIRRKVYWTAEGALKRSNVDGSGVEVLPVNSTYVGRIWFDEGTAQLFWFGPHGEPCTFACTGVFRADRDGLSETLLEKVSCTSAGCLGETPTDIVALGSD